MAINRVVEDSDDEDIEHNVSPQKAILTLAMDEESSRLPTQQWRPTDSDQPSTASSECLKRDIQDARARLMQHTPTSYDASSTIVHIAQRAYTSPTSSSRKRKRAISVTGDSNESKLRNSHAAIEPHGSSDSEVSTVQKDSKGRMLSAEWHKAVSPKGEHRRMQRSAAEVSVSSKDQQDGRDEPSANRPATIKPMPSSEPGTSTLGTNQTQPLLAYDQFSMTGGILPRPSCVSQVSDICCDLSSDLGSTSLKRKSYAQEVTRIAAEETTMFEEKRSTSLLSVLSPTQDMDGERADVQQGHPESNDGDEDELSRTLPRCQSANTGKPTVPLSSTEQADRPECKSFAEPVTGDYNPSPIITDKGNKCLQSHMSHARSSASDLGSDDDEIGLPKEKYNPKSSRSRSVRGAEDLVVPSDYSKRPELRIKTTAPARSSKRRGNSSTMEQETVDEAAHGLQDSRHDSPTDEGSGDIQSYNSRGANSEVEVTATIDGARDLPADSAPKRPRGRPRKAQKTIDGGTAVNGVEIRVEDNSTKSGSSDQTMQMRKCTDRHSSDSRSRSGAEPHRPNDDLRCLGARVPEATGLDSGEEDASSQAPAVTENKELDAGKIQTATSTTISPPGTPEKTSSIAGKGPDKHSPISSGKVAYRVGLSKRARIAPLLRIVRN